MENASPATSAQHVVELTKPQRRRRAMGLLGASTRIPPLEDGTTTYLVCRSIDGGEPTLDEIGPNHVGKKIDKDTPFVRVRSRPTAGNLTFSELLEDDNRHKYDLLLDLSWSVTDARKFLTSYALDRVWSGVPLTHAEAASWMANTVNPRVRDAVKGQTVQDVREKDSLPVRWWQTQLNRWLAPHCVSVNVHGAEWASADAARAEAEAKCAEELAQIRVQQQRQRQAEIDELRARQEYEAERAKIEAALDHSEAEKEHQRQLLEIRHRKEVFEAQAAMEQARFEMERQSLAHEARVAWGRGDEAAATAAQARQVRVEQEHNQTVVDLEAAGRALETAAEAPDNLLAQLSAPDPAKAHQAAERLTSVEFDLVPLELAVLGFAMPTQSLVQMLRDKAAADTQPVTLTKKDFITRDIGTHRVHGLEINSSLQFEFRSRRGGYVTMINIGTSGAVYMHIPNPYVPARQAHVEAGRTYLVPGPELLPWERLQQFGLDYVEVGPPGWEHIAILVADRPMVAAETLARSSGQMPIIELPGAEFEALCDRLLDAPGESWTAGVLSFQVG